MTYVEKIQGNNYVPFGNRLARLCDNWGWKLIFVKILKQTEHLKQESLKIMLGNQ